MGLKQVISWLSDFMDDDKKKQKAQRGELKEVLKTLRKKEKKLKSSLEARKSSKEKDEIQQKLDLIHAQRVKGVKLCRRIKMKCK
ncbi:hypothetical protein Mmc1_2437 [Magnetococcus marinus MC-1]|uniref:Uncharacterized protein n=1 Tax=Magnetococcus marinus (strain ATCC BAA-1437 / JCM 17883 / MC-1) TaxID=156889 RepID=A0LAE4_MAGMM|nr:hypothetical protein [Magnetococcus marinus]ABK44937.1 hypothetical protein Mmc1_2437 [Magnetococcus marinus MC-1]